MRMLVTGASGLLGFKLVEVALAKGYDVYASYLNHPVRMGVPIRLNVTDRSQVFKVVEEVNPKVIVHCAAFTDVDRCEVNRDLALKVNAEGVKHVVDAARSIGAYMVYISTDYVFNGVKGLYSEDDKPNPVNFYGYSKLKGEEYVLNSGVDFLIARASVIYGVRPASGKVNFALWLLENLKASREVKVLVDQYVSPTLNTNLAEMVLDACRRRLIGVYHMAGASRVSRLDFALKLAETFNLDCSLIRGVKMSEIHWVARRPRDSSLNVSKARRDLAVYPMEIGEALRALRREVEG